MGVREREKGRQEERRERKNRKRTKWRVEKRKAAKRTKERNKEKGKNNALFSPDTLSLPHAINCPPAIMQKLEVVPAAQGESRAAGVRPVSPATCLGECSSFWTVWPRRP